MLKFLVDKHFVVFAGNVFQQIVGIPMGTNCAPLLTDIFFYSYETEFISLCSQPAGNSWHLGSISHIGTSMMFCPSTTQGLRITGARCIPLNLRYNTRPRASASYLDLLLSIGRDGQLHTSIYDKRDDFNFHITNFPFLSSTIPASPAFMSQLIRYARACSSYWCFILRATRLSNKLLEQWYIKERLKSSLKKFYGW